MMHDTNYNDDDSFKNLARTYDSEWETCKVKQDLLEAVNNNLDIAIVIYGTLLDASISWVSSSVPALADLSPIQCMNSVNGIRKLKQVLLSFP
jgi:hypothetical protein